MRAKRFMYHQATEEQKAGKKRKRRKKKKAGGDAITERGSYAASSRPEDNRLATPASQPTLPHSDDGH